MSNVLTQGPEGPAAVGDIVGTVYKDSSGSRLYVEPLPPSLELKVNWRLKHEFGETFALGVEGYSEIEDLAHAGTFEDQKHRLGPVAYFEFGGRAPKWEFAAGALFGVSEATSDVTFKFDAEVEF